MIDSQPAQSLFLNPQSWRFYDYYCRLPIGNNHITNLRDRGIDECARNER